MPPLPTGPPSGKPGLESDRPCQKAGLFFKKDNPLLPKANPHRKITRPLCRGYHPQSGKADPLFQRQTRLGEKQTRFPGKQTRLAEKQTCAGKNKPAFQKCEPAFCKGKPDGGRANPPFQKADPLFPKANPHRTKANLLFQKANPLSGKAGCIFRAVFPRSRMGFRKRTCAGPAALSLGTGSAAAKLFNTSCGLLAEPA